MLHINGQITKAKKKILFSRKHVHFLTNTKSNTRKRIDRSLTPFYPKYSKNKIIAKYLLQI